METVNRVVSIPGTQRDTQELLTGAAVYSHQTSVRGHRQAAAAHKLEAKKERRSSFMTVQDNRLLKFAVKDLQMGNIFPHLD